MKTLYFTVAALLFSALVFAPKIPSDNSPKIIVDNKSEIALKENGIENVISKIEQNLAIDSLQIKNFNPQKYDQ